MDININNLYLDFNVESFLLIEKIHTNVADKWQPSTRAHNKQQWNSVKNLLKRRLIFFASWTTGRWWDVDPGSRMVGLAHEQAKTD